MSAVLIVLVVVGVVVGIAATLGAGPLVLIVVPLGIGLLVYAGIFAASRRSPAEVTRQAERDSPDLLGPGGADDPTR